MIVDSISVEFDAVEWLYAAALALGLSAGILGLIRMAFALMRSRPWLELLPAFVLAAAGGIALLITAWSSVTGSPVFFINLQTKLFISNLMTALLLSLALVLGLLIALIALVPDFIPRLRAGAQTIALKSVWAALVVGVGATVLLLAVRAETAGRERGTHPLGTLSGPELAAEKVADGLSFPTAFAIAPDGEMLINELSSGQIVMLQPGADGEPGELTPFIQLPLPDGGKLFHIALHPDWPQTPYVYVTAEQDIGGTRYLELLRIRNEDGVGTDVESLLSELPLEQPATSNHYGSAITFCGGNLFLSIGDTDGPDGPPSKDEKRFAQIPSRPEGKILRYQLDGIDLEPNGVVFDDPPVFAMGFRNVYAMTCDPSTGEPVVADNGPKGRDQVRVVTAGSNHEWPYTAERTRLTPPLYSSGETPLGPTGVAVRGTGSDQEVLFAALHSLSVYQLSPGGEDGAARATVFREFEAPPLAVEIDGAGCVYVLDVSSLWRIIEDHCPAQGIEPAVLTLDPSQLLAELGLEGFYGVSCSACHGGGREGVAELGPALLPSTLDQSDQFYIDTIADGRPGTPMPSWRAAGLSDSDIEQIVEWLKTNEPG